MGVDNGYTFTDLGGGECKITDFDPGSCTEGTDPVIPATLGTASLTVIHIENNAMKSKGLTSITFNNEIDISYNACSHNSGMAVNMHANVTTNECLSTNDPPFESCNISANLTIGTSVTTIDALCFYNSGLYGSLTFSSAITTIDNRAFGANSLTDVNFDYSANISYNAFYSNSGLSVVMSANVTTTGCSSTSDPPFESCNISANLTIGTSVTTIDDYCFYNSGLYGSLTFHSALTTISSYSFGANSLTDVNFDYAVDLDDYCFNNNSGLSVVLSADITCVGVSSYSHAPFMGCNISGNLTIGNNVTEIPRYLFYNSGLYGSLNFSSNLAKLRQVSFASNLITELTFDYTPDIYPDAFSNCTALETINLNNDVTTSQVFVTTDAPFSNCPLSDLAIGTSVTTIDDWIFYDSGLTEVILPSGITNVNAHSFANCTALETFKVLNSTTSFGSAILTGNMSTTAKGTIYGFAGSTAYDLWNTGNVSDYYDFNGLEPLSMTVKGVNVDNYIKKNSLRISKGLGNVNNLNVTFNCQASDWMPREGQDIKMDLDGTTWFGGVIKKVKIKKIDPTKTSDAYTEYFVSSNGYNDVCERRTVSVYFENRTAGYIFEWLVDNVLNLAGYSEGITKGDITAGITFDKYGAICKSVKTIYDDIAKQSGVQWNIDETKTVDFVTEKTITTGEHTIDVSGSFTDYKVTSFTRNLANYCNKVFVKGESDGFYVACEDTAEITARQAIEGTAYSSGVYGKVIQASDINSSSDLTIIGDNELKKYSFAPIEFQIKSSTSSWTVGEKIQCYLPDRGMTANADFIVSRIDIARVDNIIDYGVTLTRRDSADFSTQKENKGFEFFEEFLGDKGKGFKVGETAKPQNYQDSTTQNITITAETTITSRNFTLTYDSDIQISFSAKCEVTAVTTVTANTKIIKDGTTSSGTFYPELVISSSGTLQYSAFFNAVTSNDTTVYVTLNTDGNDVVVDTAQATMNLQIMPNYLTE